MCRRWSLMSFRVMVSMYLYYSSNIVGYKCYICLKVCESRCLLNCCCSCSVFSFPALSSTFIEIMAQNWTQHVQVLINIITHRPQKQPKELTPSRMLKNKKKPQRIIDFMLSLILYKKKKIWENHDWNGIILFEKEFLF